MGHHGGVQGAAENSIVPRSWCPSMTIVISVALINKLEVEFPLSPMVLEKKAIFTSYYVIFVLT